MTLAAHWIGLKTLILRECRVILRFWSVTLAPPVIMTILYFTIFGEVIGKRVGRVDGVDYIQYLAPGLVLLWVIPYSYGHTAAGFLGARLFRYVEEVLVAPLPGWTVVLSYVLGGVIRGVLVGTVALTTTILFTLAAVHSLCESLVIGRLAALVSALGGLITALLATSFEQVTTIQTLILTPLIYVGGVFSPASAFPAWAQLLSVANPMFYAVNALRYSFLGVSDVNFAMSLFAMCTSAVLLFVVALMLISRGVGIRE